MNDGLEAGLAAEVLAQELERFAARLRHETVRGPSCDETSANVKKPPDQRITYCPSSYVELARRIYRARRDREKFLPADLFGEPVWDMLLDLYVKRAENREINVTSLSLASGVPPTTSLRWIALLEERGLLFRNPAVHDKRVHYVSLTQEGIRSIHRFLRYVEGDGAALSPFLLREKW